MDYHECNKEQLIHFCEKLQRKMTKYENRLSGINISISFFVYYLKISNPSKFFDYNKEESGNIFILNFVCSSMIPQCLKKNKQSYMPLNTFTANYAYIHSSSPYVHRQLCIYIRRSLPTLNCQLRIHT